MTERTKRPRRAHRLVAGFFALTLTLLAGVIAAEEFRFVGDALERQGVDAFYAQPSPVPTGAPGAIVKVDELMGTPLASRAWRIMYHSRDLNGADVIVTGVVVTPIGPAPAGGRTVVSWAHPTTGTAPDCAPSYGFDPFSLIEGLRVLLARGYTVVATDYAGMGTVGPDSYLIGATAGNNVLDAVRAAQQIPGAQAGSDVILWGHSQGGQAVLFAAERAKDYAPELTIRAVAAAAPAANLPSLMKAHLGDISGVTIGSYAFSAFSQVYADTPGTQLESILTPEAIAALPAMNRLCLLQNVSELHAIGQPLVGNFTTNDPTTTEPWASLLAANSAGSVAFDAPLFLAQGLDDKLVVPDDTRAFAEHEASLGMKVTFEPISFASHGTVAYLAIPGLVAWLDREVPAR